MQFTIINWSPRIYKYGAAALIVFSVIIISSCFVHYPRMTRDQSPNYKWQDSLRLSAILNDTLFRAEEIDTYLSDSNKKSISPYLDSSHVPTVKVLISNISKASLFVTVKNIIYWIDPGLVGETAVVYKFGRGSEVYSLPRNDGITSSHLPMVYPEHKIRPGESIELFSRLHILLAKPYKSLPKGRYWLLIGYQNYWTKAEGGQKDWTGKIYSDTLWFQII